MSIFDTQTTTATAETTVILQFMTESVELDYDEVNGRSIFSLFEENASDLGITQIRSASFRSSTGENIGGMNIVQPGQAYTASVSHDSKGI